MDRIDVLANGRPASHLAVRYEAPERLAGPKAPLCILYLHGLGSVQNGEKAEFFRHAALSAGYAFCSFDFQGHGASGGGLHEITLSRNLADVELVWQYLAGHGHARICLLGSSMGGGTALWFSALHPERVVAGLHIAPALELERGLLAWAGTERARIWQETGTIHFVNELVATDLGWGLIEDLRIHPVEELRSRYRTPTLLLQGKLDTQVSWKSVVDFATHCPYKEIDLHLFADGDHRLTDRKERLWELMQEFLYGRGLI
ncbi:MAG TPA: alpha/beta fold hydrolase [Thermoanaerobaculia bacterium]|nr:alpha/beta fold hydrolase [Thermoanaerobaculia bacterium]